MNASSLSPAACALFLVAAFSIAGLCQAWWLGSASSQRFAVPIDGGWRIRGRRVFGDNKTIRGFVVMVPASGASFVLLASIANATAVDEGLWPMTLGGYALVGAMAGLGFMAGELPNSFLKRQLDVAPGQPPPGETARVVWFLVDRLDSVLGMMAVLVWLVPVPALTWAWVLLLGPALHGVFSVLVFHLGGKARAA